MIVLTACLILMFGVGCFIVYAYNEKKLTIEHIIIIAGLGYTAARETYFRGVRRGSSKAD